MKFFRGARPSSLNAHRDRYVERVRRLRERFLELLESHPATLKGILGRAKSVFEAQDSSLEALAAADLEARELAADEQRAVAEILLRAQHLPRMILAFGRLLREEKKESQALLPIEAEVLEVARGLAELIQEWVLLHEDELDLEGEAQAEDYDL
jgi:hypothetical protein